MSKKQIYFKQTFKEKANPVIDKSKLIEVLNRPDTNIYILEDTLYMDETQQFKIAIDITNFEFANEKR